MNPAETPAVVYDPYAFSAAAGVGAGLPADGTFNSRRATLYQGIGVRRGLRGLGEYYENGDARGTVRDGIFTTYAGLGKADPVACVDDTFLYKYEPTAADPAMCTKKIKPLPIIAGVVGLVGLGWLLLRKRR